MADVVVRPAMAAAGGPDHEPCPSRGGVAARSVSPAGRTPRTPSADGFLGVPAPGRRRVVVPALQRTSGDRSRARAPRGRPAGGLFRSDALLFSPAPFPPVVRLSFPRRIREARRGPKPLVVTWTSVSGGTAGEGNPGHCAASAPVRQTARVPRPVSTGGQPADATTARALGPQGRSKSEGRNFACFSDLPSAVPRRPTVGPTSGRSCSGRICRHPRGSGACSVASPPPGLSTGFPTRLCGAMVRRPPDAGRRGAGPRLDARSAASAAGVDAFPCGGGLGRAHCPRPSLAFVRVGEHELDARLPPRLRAGASPRSVGVRSRLSYPPRIPLPPGSTTAPRGRRPATGTPCGRLVLRHATIFGTGPDLCALYRQRLASTAYPNLWLWRCTSLPGRVRAIPPGAPARSAGHCRSVRVSRPDALRRLPSVLLLGWPLCVDRWPARHAVERGMSRRVV